MKHIASFIVTLIFSINSFAAAELVINDSPLTLLLSDNNQARVSNCLDFIALRKAGETVKNLPGLSDPDYGLARAALFDCYIKAYVIQQQLQEIETQKSSLEEILHHLPATEKFLASDDEKVRIEKEFKNKSVWDASPDLIKKDDTFISQNDDTGYRLIDSRMYKLPNNKEINILTVAAFTLHGTFGVRNNYIITSKDKAIWEFVKIDENSPL